MKTLIFAILMGVASTNSSAQLRKCVAPDGRVTYSDVVCKSGATTGRIANENGNTLDTSGFRAEAERAQIEGGMGDAPVQCQFKFYESDQKSVVLANQAKAECIRNIQSSKKGLSTNLESYQLWKDHYDQATALRQAKKDRAHAFLNANQTPKCFSSGLSIRCGGEQKR